MLEANTLEIHYQRVQDFGLVCLALTSSDFYRICKTVHPAPLPTKRGDGLRDENGVYWSWSLERHVGEFLGPKYEVREVDERYGEWFSLWCVEIIATSLLIWNMYRFLYPIWTPVPP